MIGLFQLETRQRPPPGHLCMESPEMAIGSYAVSAPLNRERKNPHCLGPTATHSVPFEPAVLVNNFANTFSCMKSTSGASSDGEVRGS